MTVKHARFIKGHGTENDFIVLLDPDGDLDLHPHHVQNLCNRRRGLGADGVLRAIRSTQHADARPMAHEAEWFMDYWNPDGTIAGMCGNGIRLFTHVLLQADLVKTTTTDIPIATRAGTRHVQQNRGTGDFTVNMGRAQLPGPDTVTVSAGSRRWPALHVDMGNPHAVVFVDALMDAGDLLTPPVVTPTVAYPHGVTVEFVTRHAPGHLTLRVHERGVGETRSCGTGACAAVVAALRQDGINPTNPESPVRYTVDVPGGRLDVIVQPGGEIHLTGPAEGTAEGTVVLGHHSPIMSLDISPRDTS